MIRKYLIALFILLCSAVHAQESFVGFTTGLGFYSMSNLKSLLATVQEGSELNPQLVSNFPPFLYYMPYYKVKGQRVNYGVGAGLYSTGSRLSLSDYSGSYLFDLRINAIQLAPFVEVKMAKINRIDLLMRSDFGVAMSTMSMNERLVLDNEKLADESGRFIAFSLHFKPGFRANYQISKKLTASAGVDYQFDVSDFNFNLISHGSTQRVNFKPEWSGLRIALGVEYLL